MASIGFKSFLINTTNVTGTALRFHSDSEVVHSFSFSYDILLSIKKWQSTNMHNISVVAQFFISFSNHLPILSNVSIENSSFFEAIKKVAKLASSNKPVDINISPKSK